MKKVLFTFIFLSLAMHVMAQGDSVVWNFTDGISNGTVNPANNLSGSNFTCSALSASVTLAVNTTSPVGNNDYSPSSQGNNLAVTCPAGGAYIQWTITPKNNFKVGVTAIQFGMRSTTTGPKAWALRSSKDNYVANLAADTNANNSKWALHTAPLHYTIDAEAVTFRIYFSGGTSSGSGNLRIDDIKLSLTPPMIAVSPKQLQISTSLNTPSAMPVVVRGMMLEQDVAVTSNNADFTVDKSSLPLAAINAAPQTLNVTFSGAAAGNGKILLKSMASGVDITDTIFVAGAVGMPAIAVSPTEVSFTTTEAGSLALQTLRVTGSYLSDSIYLDFTAGDSVFSASPKVLYKVANQATVSLRYTPLSAGVTEGTLRLRSAHASDVFVSVSGSAIASDTSGGIPEGYYNIAENKRDTLLKTTLHNLIKGHTEITYEYVWVAYRDLDIRPECPKYTGETPDGTVSILDIYSDRPGCLPDSGSCTTTFNPPGPCYGFKAYRAGIDQQGGAGDPGGGTEGNSYNREHSFPKSWWDNSGTGATQHNDLHHLFPTDRGVNSTRNNYPYCEVASPTRTTSNGSKFGPCAYSFPGGYTGGSFEPINEYKGDLARVYFYMATRYENVFDSWGSNDEAKPMLAGNKYPGFKPWAVSMLLKWHRQDPVSKKEKDRNNTIYSKYQRNRNPFVDHPELAEYIWGDSIGKVWSLSIAPPDTAPKPPDTVPTYTVTFNACGGSDVPSQQVKRDSLVLQPAKPTRDSFTFVGWVVNTISNVAWNFSTSTVTSDTTLYAKWKPDTVIETVTVAWKIQDVAFLLFPNPNAGEFTIMLPNGEAPAAVDVYSTAGILYPCISVGTHRYRVNAPKGLYFVRVKTKGSSGVRKFYLAR